MAGFFRSVIAKGLHWIGHGRDRDALASFRDPYYQQHTLRRLEHLASLNLDIAGSTVLEVGAGIGDQTHFFIDRGCRVVTSDVRPENLEALRSRYPGVRVLQLDLDNPSEAFNEKFEIVHCYGLLYHLQDPARALKFLAGCCTKMLLLCTCVSFGEDASLNPITEDPGLGVNSVHGTGCRPTRKWVYDELKKHFKFVYLPATQPGHPEFPLNWSAPELHKGPYARAVFVASRQKIDNALLKEEIPAKQVAQ